MSAKETRPAAKGRRASISANLDAAIARAPGVESLFQDNATPLSRTEIAVIASAHGWRLVDLPLNSIEPDPQQPRQLPLPALLHEQERAGDAVAQVLMRGLQELADSIRQSGVMQPIIVYAIDNSSRYRIYKGQRRWHAAQLANLHDIPAVIVPQPGAVQKIVEQVDENVQRADLSDISRAVAMVTLRDALKRDGGTLRVPVSGDDPQEIVLPQGKDVPWRIIESYFRVGESRRKQLVDLLLIDDVARQRAEMAGLGEFVLRPLVEAIKADKDGEWLTAQVQQETIAFILSLREITSSQVAQYLETHPEHRRSLDRQPLAPAPTARTQRAEFLFNSVKQLEKSTTYLKRLPGKKEFRSLSQTERQTLRDAANQLLDEARDILRQLDSDAPR